ncbi:hypothetical protein SAMN05660748_2336 [Blastococcus aggregatus]|uniref:Uncharacterized protein n=1 Tax=Blastococcus aggregatus TaxID=38502 RepID=A0A285V7Q7_9ACTN|nr:hypothetical protein [Blastococcus aggregatus]SOC49608.1 hypothetical protein SAMN05660748_2336 [Blastococcus aggregatus]
MPALDERMQALEAAATEATLTSAFCDVPGCALVLHPDRLDVRAVGSRHVPEPDRPWRRVVQGAGAVVLGVRVAFAARAWAVQVERLPRPDDPGLLAVLRPVPGAPEPGLAQLAGTAAQGPVRRRPLALRRLPPTLLEQLGRAAAAEGAVLVPVPPEQDGTVAQLEREALAIRGQDPGPARDSLTEADDDAPGSFLLLVTDADDELAWLRSGEASERVLLELARAGWRATVVPHVLDAPLTRADVRSALSWDDHPQSLIRVA